VLLYIIWVTYAERWLPTLLWWPVSLAASALIAIHYLPGFIPLRLFPWDLASASPPIQMIWLPWDKALVALTLLAWWLRRPKQPLVSLDITALAFCLTFFVVPLLSIMTNAASWQPKWPDAFWWWLVLNVGVVSLAEEAFFRGLLQSQLIRWFGAWPGIIVATLAYAALHLLVNPVYALLAGIAGLGYGMVLHFSGRLSLAVLLHASINTLHFLLLSYPFRLISE
ncbi:CPBP family intramembrane metalloprotease, partial [Pseudomonas aeruginosa]